MNTHGAIGARCASALRQDVFRLNQRFRAILPILRVFDAQHDGADAARFIRYAISRRGAIAN